jgi:integrase
MPRQSKGARLWLKPAGQDRAAVWVIKDGGHRLSTGCSPDDREEAERALAEYIHQKYDPRQGSRDPAKILVSDVLTLYQRDVGITVARPRELGQRVETLLAFWGNKKLAEVNGSTCRTYASARLSKSGARRELEDLRSAINYHRKEGLCDKMVDVTLPEPSAARERWLTRSEVARLIWAAWRYRETQKGIQTERRSRQHVARFILVALYTGTRSGAVCGASIVQEDGRGYVDLERGLFYRRPSGATITKKKQPTILLPDRLLVHMRRWAAKGISQRAVIEFGGESVLSVRKAFARAAKDAGLPDVTPHVLRHTAASWAMQAGANTYAAAKYLGMTQEIIENTYGHLHPDNQTEIWNAITRKRK